MRTRETSKISIYDPNWVNPYGIELSSVISAEGYSVDLWCTDNRHRSLPGVRLRASLPTGDRAHNDLVRLAIRRLWAPVRVLLSSAWKSPLIVVWTRDPWDALLFSLRGLLGGSIIFIYHNPLRERRRGGLSGRMERLLVRASSLCVVHSLRLADACSSQFRSVRVRVAAHPPYRVTTNQHQDVEAQTRQSESDERVVAFLGALRRDKGADDIAAIATRVPPPWLLRILGPDRLPNSTVNYLQELGISCEHVGTGNGPSDGDLIAGLQRANVVIAPYRSVTESGSIHLTLGLGVPVLAYDSPGLAHVVNARSTATSATGLGDLVSDFLAQPWPTYTPHAFELYRKCTNDWQGILDESCK